MPAETSVVEPTAPPTVANSTPPIARRGLPNPVGAGSYKTDGGFGHCVAIVASDSVNRPPKTLPSIDHRYTLLIAVTAANSIACTDAAPAAFTANSYADKLAHSDPRLWPRYVADADT